MTQSSLDQLESLLRVYHAEKLESGRPSVQPKAIAEFLGIEDMGLVNMIYCRSAGYVKRCRQAAGLEPNEKKQGNTDRYVSHENKFCLR